jgi:dual specificity phosphatase 3
MTITSSASFELANASWVTDRLLVGGDLDAMNAELATAQLRELTAAGVTHIIDVRVECNDEDVVTSVDPGLNYLWAGIDDAGQLVPDEWFDKTVGHVTAALADPRSVVLTHCHMGINRGPSLGYAVLLAQGWDPVEALAAIRAARPIAYVAYAEDALRWHHSTTGVTVAERRADHARLRDWRQANPLDLVRVIAGERGLGR